jgi:hypothetical protein
VSSSTATHRLKHSTYRPQALCSTTICTYADPGLRTDIHQLLPERQAVYCTLWLQHKQHARPYCVQEYIAGSTLMATPGSHNPAAAIQVHCRGPGAPPQSDTKQSCSQPKHPNSATAADVPVDSRLLVSAASLSLCHPRITPSAAAAATQDAAVSRTGNRAGNRAGNRTGNRTGRGWMGG